MQSYYPYCWWILVKSNWNWSVLGHPFAGFLPFQFTHRSPSNWWVFAEDEDLALAMNHHFRLKKPPKKTEGVILLWHSPMNHLAASMANLTFKHLSNEPMRSDRILPLKTHQFVKQIAKRVQGIFQGQQQCWNTTLYKASIIGQASQPRQHTQEQYLSQWWLVMDVWISNHFP